MTLRIGALLIALATYPALIAADAPAPASAPQPMVSSKWWDTDLAIPLGTPCPDEGAETTQQITYKPHIVISDDSRAAFAHENARDLLSAAVFTYLDGHATVLVRRDAKVDVALRAAVHAYGNTIGMRPVLGSCPHLGGAFGILIHVSTGELRLVPLAADLSGYT